MHFTVGVTLTLTLSPEVLKFAELITGKSLTISSAAKPDKTVATQVMQDDNTGSEPSTKPQPEPEEKPSPKGKAITIEAIRALAAQKDKSKIRSLLSDFDVPNLSSLAKEAYPSFYERLGAL